MFNAKLIRTIILSSVCSVADPMCSYSCFIFICMLSHLYNNVD